MSLFFLTNTPLFHSIRENEIKELLSCLNAHEREYKKEEIILRAGDTVSQIGLVEEGDIIAIDIPNHSVTLKVGEQELAARKAAWNCPEPKVKTGYLARYAKLVTSADKGAILQ